MKSKRTGLAIIGLLLLIFIVSKFNMVEQTTTEKIYQLSSTTEMTPQEMQEDIDYLIAKISASHPSTIKGIPEYLQESIDSVQNQITLPMTAGDFYFKVSEITSSLRDAHTYVHLASTKNSKSLNFPIVWLKRSMVVTKDTDVLKLGDEVIKIGNKTLPNIFDSLKSFIPAENEGWVRARAQSELTKEVVLRYLGLINPDNTVTVTFNRDKEQITAKLPLHNSADLIKNNKNKVPNTNSIFYDEMSLAVFQLNKCVYDNNYKNQLKKFFKEVAAKKIKHVAIDVRENTGGSSKVIGELISYLGSVKDVKYFSSLVRYSKDAAKQRSYISRTSGSKDYTDVFNVNDHKADGLLFNGEVYVLTSNKTFSSACQLAVICYDNEIAKIIGEPTGNAPTRYGDLLSFQLPNSGYSFGISFKKWIRPLTKNDPASSLTPHEIVYTVAEDIKEDTDAQIEALLRLISDE